MVALQICYCICYNSFSNGKDKLAKAFIKDSNTFISIFIVFCTSIFVSTQISTLLSIISSINKLY